MKSYEYARLIFKNYAEILSTDPKVIKWLSEELKKIIPSAEVLIERKDLLDNTIMLQFHKLSNKDDAAFFWLKQKLCQNGWEPFAIVQDHNGDTTGIHFRLETTI